MTGSLEDRLRTQFVTIQAIGQISTSSGEEVLCTSGDRDSRVQSSRLAAAFVEIDQLSKSLKLGSIRQVIISRSDPDSSAAKTDSIVQSKLQAEDKSEDSDSLLTTTVAPTLQNALIGDNIISETTKQVLKG